MREQELATQLGRKMKQQLKLRSQINRMHDSSEIHVAIERLEQLRNECIELMEQYFRRTVYPMIAKRFPGKIGPDKYVAQFTQLLADFFIEIKQRFDDQLWIQTSPAMLRDYASTVISRDVYDLLRRYRIGSEAASVHALKTAIAKDAERRMAEDQLNLKQVLEILEKWDRSGTEQQRKFAQVIRLYYIVELNDDEVDRDAGLTLKEIAERTGTPLATVARWREKALEALRKDVEDVH